MCRNVYVSGHRCSCVGDLAHAIGGSMYVVAYDDALLEPNDCLCPVNLEATAKRAGFTAYVMEGDVNDDFPGDWIFKRAGDFR